MKNPREKWLYFPGITPESGRTSGAGQAQSWGLETKLRSWSLWSSKLSTGWPETPLWHRPEVSPSCTSAGGHRTLRRAETSCRHDWVILKLTSSPEPSQSQQRVRGCFSGGSLSPFEKNDQPCLGECVCVCVCVCTCVLGQGTYWLALDMGECVCVCVCVCVCAGMGVGAGENRSQPVLPTINNPHLHNWIVHPMLSSSLLSVNGQPNT